MIQEFLKAPWLFSFFQAVYLAEAASGGMDMIGRLGPVEQEPVRFRGQFGLGFPSSEIGKVRLHLDDGQAREFVEMEANLFGLYGSASPLASDVTEMLIHQDETGTMRDFLDIFNHRLVSLLYRIWHTSQVERLRTADLSDFFSFVSLCLAGLGDDVSSPELDKGSLLYNIRNIVGWTRAAHDLEAVLRGQFPQNDWRIEEFVPRQLDLPPEFQWRLGFAETGMLGTLGVDLVLGDRMTDVIGRIRLWVCAADWSNYNALLPSGTIFSLTQELLRGLLRDALEVQLVPYLPVEKIECARLSPESDSAIGLNAWLGRPQGASTVWPSFTLE